MNKGLNADSQIHISVALLIKAGLLICVVVGSWYQAQMQFANHKIRIDDLENKIVVLTASVEGMEQEHIKSLQSAKVQLEEENKSLMQKLGLKK